MPSPRASGGARAISHVRTRSLTSPPQLRFYSTHLQSTVSQVTQIPSASCDHANQTAINSAFGKSSCVQQMWFHGQLANNRLSKEELSRNIAAMLDEDHGLALQNSPSASDGTTNISLLVGEIIHAAQDPSNHELQINNVRLSNVCSPRTVLSGRTKQSPVDLCGRKVVVAIVSNLSLRHSRGNFSEGVLLCNATGELLSPDSTTRVGEKVKLVGSGSLLNHLHFNDKGFVNFCHGNLSSEEGQIISTC